MAPDPEPPEDPSVLDPRDDPEDAVRLRGYATALADGVEQALAPWVRRSVERVWAQWRSGPGAGGDPHLDLQVAAETAAAAQRCRDDLAPVVRAVLLTDIDEQRTNPLAVVRRAVPYPTEVLRGAGVPPVERDDQSRSHFPGDDYDLTPATFADLDPALHEPGLVWGAAKAHVHLRRRRADGQR